ncbi:glycosyltransferase family 39 protein [Azospirillum canadense]|uniref:glycosyltransferase family 39 protein n=1 Tax=Azospirillum canadense TaxID=403962 RepID=UPI002227885A|nr:glycosyltransferase family 39 protein [Azospirillum canadense]MCW2240859.1 hypothetical protein [Azospirillum canadense]
MMITNDADTHAPALRNRMAGQMIGVGTAGIAALSLGLLVYGFLQTGLTPRSFWSDAGLTRFLIFAGLSGIVAAGAACAGAPRRLLAIGAAGGLWLVAAFGVGPVASVTIVGLACLTVGDLLFGPLWRARFGLATAGLLATCVGLALLMLVIGLVAALPVHTTASYAAALGLLLLAGRRRLRLYAAGAASWLARSGSMGLREYAACALLVFALATQSVYAALPEQYHDALGVHLLVATTMAQHGAWTPDPAQLINAVWPQGANWLFAVCYILAGESGAKLANFALLALLCGLLGNAVAWRHGRACGFLAAALLVSTPLAFIETASLFAENALAVFFLAATLLLVRSHRDLGLRDGAAVAVLLAGGALVKLHAAFFILAFGLIFTAVLLRSHAPRRALTILAVSAVLTALLACQPYLHAYLVTGNPIFPWFNAVFKSPLFDSTANFADTNWTGKLSPFLPYLWTFHSSRFMEGHDGALGFAVLGLLLPGLAVAAARRDRMALTAAAAGLGYAVLLAPVTQYLRYFYPALPLILVACASGLRAFERPFDNKGRHTTPARPRSDLTFGSLALGSLIIGSGIAFLPSAGWILSSFDTNIVVTARDRESFVEGRVPYRGLIKAVNALAGPEARVLILGQPVGAGLAGTPVYGNWYNPKVSLELAFANTVEKAAAALHRNGITHVFWRPGAVPPDTPVARLLQKTGTPVAKVGDAVLYGVSITMEGGLNLLANSDFAEGLAQWDNAGFAGPVGPGPLVVPPGGIIAQATPVESGETLVYAATFACAGEPATARLQVNWLDASGRIIDVFIRPDDCTGPEAKTSTVSLAAPAAARTAFVFFNGDPIRPVSLRRLAFMRP